MNQRSRRRKREAIRQRRFYGESIPSFICVSCGNRWEDENYGRDDMGRGVCGGCGSIYYKWDNYEECVG